MNEARGLRVLSIGIDSTLLDPEGLGQDTVRRQLLYARRLGELHIIVKSAPETGCRTRQLADNLWVHPTASLSRWLFPFDALRLARRLHRAHAFEVVTSQDPFACGLAATLFRRIAGVPWNCQIHADFFGNPNWAGESLLHRVATPLGLRLALAADSRRVGTQHERKRIVELGAPGDTTYCVPVSVAIERPSPTAHDQRRRDRGAFRFLWVGRFVRQKDLPTLIAAFARARERCPAGAVELTLAGDGPLRPAVEQRVEALGLSSAVRFLGWVASTQLAALYAEHDAVVMSSLYEGTCRVIIEAGLAGLPAVATGFAGAVDNIVHAQTGCVVPIGDVEAFAEAMISLALDPPLASRMGGRAQEMLAAKHDPEELADQVVAMLAATARGRR